MEGPSAVTPNNVLAATGVRVEDVEDLVVALPGDDFELTRHYQNTMRIGGDGSFGPASAGGWTFSVDTRVVRGAWQQGPPNTIDHTGTDYPFNGTPKFGQNGLLILAAAPNRDTAIFHNLDQPPEQSDVFRPLGPGTQRIVAINDWADTNISEVPQSSHEPVVHDVWAYSDGAGGGTTVFFRPDDSHESNVVRKNQLAGRIWQQIDEFGNTWTYEYTWFPVPGRIDTQAGGLPLQLPRLSNIWLHGRYPGDPNTKARVSFRWDVTPVGQAGEPDGTGQVKAVILQRPYQASDGIHWITEKIINYTYRKDFIHEWLLLHPPETGTVGTPEWFHLGHVESLVRVDSRTVVNMPVQGGDRIVPKTLNLGPSNASSLLWQTVLYRYQFYTEESGEKRCALRGIVLPEGLDQISNDVLDEYPGWSSILISDRLAYERDVKAFKLMSVDDEGSIPIWSGRDAVTATPKELSEKWITCVSSGVHSGRVSEELSLRQRFYDDVEEYPYLAHARKVMYSYARSGRSGVDRLLARSASRDNGSTTFATLFRYTTEERAFDYDATLKDYKGKKVTRHISEDKLLYAVQQKINNNNNPGKRYFTRSVPFTIATIIADPGEAESGYATNVWCTRTLYDDYNRRIKTLPPSRVTGAVLKLSGPQESDNEWFALTLANSPVGQGSTSAEETEYVDAPIVGEWEVLCNLPCSTLVKRMWRDIGPSAQSPGPQLISETIYTDGNQEPADPLRCQLPLKMITIRRYLDANANSSEASAAPDIVQTYQYKLRQSAWLDSRLIRPIETITRTQALDATPLGPGGVAEEIVGVDKTGEIAWRKHADGSFEYFDYDVRTGMPTLLVSGTSPSLMNAVFASQTGSERTLAWIAARHPTASAWGDGATSATELVSERLYNLAGSLVRSSGPQRTWTDYIYGATRQRNVVVATVPPVLASGIDGIERYSGLTTIAYYNEAMNPYRVYSFAGVAVERDATTGHAVACNTEPQLLTSNRECRYRNNGQWLTFDKTDTGSTAAGIPYSSRAVGCTYDNDGNVISETSADGDTTVYERNVMGSVRRTRIRGAITDYILDQYSSLPVGSPTFASGIGDGRPTFVLEYRANTSSGSSPSDPVISRRFYDNWGRGTAECHVDSANPFGLSVDPISVRRFDVVGNILEQGLFPAGSSPSAAAECPNLWLSSVAGGVTRTRYGLNGAKCEDLARVTAGSTEADTTSLSTRYFHDASGRQIAQQSPGSTLQRTLFDTAGRVTKVLECRPAVSAESPAATYAQIADPSSLVVLSETEFKYAEHASGHPVTGSTGTSLQCMQITRRRADSDSASEATSTTPPLGNSPVTAYQLSGFDGAGRTLASINLGSLATDASSKVAQSILGESTAVTPACPPFPLFDLGDDGFDLYTDAGGGGTFDLHASGGTATRFRYRDDGQLTDTVEYLSTTDRRVTHRIADGFGRETHVIDNYDPATIKIGDTDDHSYSIVGIGRVRFSPSSAPSTNRVHYREYENDHLYQEGTCYLEGGTTVRSQLTKYQYDDVAVGGGTHPPQGALRHIRTIYPSPTTGQPVRANEHPYDGVTGGEVSFQYNLRGELVSITDQNGTVKQLNYDAAGRAIREYISSPAAGVGTSTLAIRTQYDSFGRVAARFSDADPNTPATTADVSYQYNDVGDVVAMAQGGARTYLGIYELPGYGGTSASDVHRHSLVRFGLLATGDSSSACGPTRSVHHLSYEPLTAALSVASRISKVQFGLPGSACGTPNAGSVQYTRMGGGQVAITDLPAIDMQLDRTVNAAGQRRWGADDSAPAGQYGGWDGFGRLVRNTWMKSTGPLWQELYAYDDLSRRVSSDQLVSTSRFADRDWRLSYDRLDHLTDAQVGRVSGSVFANLPGASHRWAVDALGNFTSIKTDLDGDGDFVGGDSIEGRTHNLQNELTQAGGDHLSYDANGNLTVISTQPDGGGTILRRFTYDAWNRLVKVEIPAEQKVVTYTYNALHWRVGETVFLNGNVTNPAETHQFYYSPDWRLLEEETSVASGSSGSTTWATSSTQYFFGVRSLDDVVLVAHDANNDGDLEDTGDCAWYQLTDSRFSPVVTVDAKANPGRVLQQIVYGAYGDQSASTPADFNGDGFQDYSDFDDFYAAFVAGLPSSDFNGDGLLDFSDFDDFVVAFEATNPPAAMLPPRIGFGGYQYDSNTGYLLARNRWYDPVLSRWLTRDPAGYVDGMNLYLYVRANPLSLIDPMGLWGWDRDWIQMGVGGLLGLQGSVTAAAGWSEAAHAAKNEAVGAKNLVVQAGANALDTVGMSVDAATGFNLDYQPVGELGKSSAEGAASWEQVSLETKNIAGRAGLAVMTAGASEVAIGVAEYAKTGDGDALSRHMGGLAAGNLAAAGMLRTNVLEAGSGSADAPVTSSVGELRASGLKDAHHIIQDAAVRNLPGYDTNAAPGLQLTGPATTKGSPHFRATQVQRESGGGNYAAERRIGYKALRRAGADSSTARRAIEEADAWFENTLNVDASTPTRIPRNRK